VHATLISSEPAADSHLAASPTRVRLVFSEPIEGNLARVTLVPGSGAPLVLRAGADPRDVHAVIARVDSLATGKYRVQWRVVSADGHAVDGSYLFAVGDTTLGGRPPNLRLLSRRRRSSPLSRNGCLGSVGRRRAADSRHRPWRGARRAHRRVRRAAVPRDRRA
jgi:methionine-rich copper-binding protein CopC